MNPMPRCGIFLLFLLSITAHAQHGSVDITAYNQKGEMGKITVNAPDAFNIEADTALDWNNRRYRLSEKITLDASGYPLKVEISGMSAFGAPIKETFTRSGGKASWESLKESGETDSGGFYIPADMGSASRTALLRAILADESGGVDLLPSGRATARKVATRDIQQGESTREISLYALEGLELMPQYYWFDENLMPVGYGEPSWGALLADYDKSQLEALGKARSDAEREHLHAMAGQLTDGYDSLLISNVRVVDVEQKRTLEAQDVLLKNGKIAAVAPHPSSLTAVKTVEGQDKTLIPGLWDMHGHLSTSVGPFYIASGVTSVRDIGNAHARIMRVEATFNDGKVIGPNVYRSGFMDRFSEYSSGLSVKSLDEAHNTIDWFADNGYLQLKLYSSIEPAWVPALVEHAHTRGMRVSGHIPAFMNAEQAVDAGFDEIQHINMLFLTFLGGEKIDTRQQLRFSIPGERSHTVDLDSPEVTALIDKLKRERIVVDPTLATFRSMFLRRAGIVDPEFESIAGNMPPQFLRDDLSGAEMDIPDAQLDDYAKSAAALSDMVKRLHDAGVWLVPGTDHPAWGLALQQELIDYAGAGISTIDVIELATLGAAKLVGAANHTGSITVGKDADVVLIDGNPIDDMTHLRKATLVIKGNRIYQPAQVFEAINISPFAGTTTINGGKSVH